MPSHLQQPFRTLLYLIEEYEYLRVDQHSRYFTTGFVATVADPQRQGGRYPLLNKDDNLVLFKTSDSPCIAIQPMMFRLTKLGLIWTSSNINNDNSNNSLFSSSSALSSILQDGE